MAFAVWKLRIEKEYKELQETRNVDVKKAWCENWNKCDEELNQNPIQGAWQVEHSNKSSEPCILKECKPIPHMLNWVLTPSNFLSQNENVLLNMPDINLDQNDERNKFFEDLLKDFGGVHQGSHKLLDIDDAMLVELIQNLHKKYTPTRARTAEPSSVIFEALSEYFNSKVTVQQIKERYMQILHRQEIQPTNLAPNTCDHTVKVFKKYFCRRCYIYNCQMHREVSIVPSTKPYQNKTISQITVATEACGNSCFIIRKSLRNVNRIPLHMNNIKTGDDTMDGTIKIKPQWSEDEKTLFQELQKIFPYQYCKIAKAMLTRSCQEVYLFSKENISIAISEGSPKNSLSLQRCSKQKKKNKGWKLYQNKVSARRGDILPNSYNFSPCFHPGKSCDNDCPCVSLGNACEKFCLCDLNCNNRVTGCLCRTSCSKMKCPCFASLRECDPDLCQGCGASEYNLQNVICKNISIQRKLNKHLLLAPSDVAGWGIFLKDGARKNDFISEYVGEMISQAEADRRGRIYDVKKSSFLFELNRDTVLDATCQGSKVRFVNHSINPNCYAKVLMVLGNHRIGIFAKRDITPGEELFFDYRYTPIDQMKFVSIERKEVCAKKKVSLKN